LQVSEERLNFKRKQVIEKFYYIIQNEYWTVERN